MFLREFMYVVKALENIRLDKMNGRTYWFILIKKVVIRAINHCSHIFIMFKEGLGWMNSSSIRY